VVRWCWSTATLSKLNKHLMWMRCSPGGARNRPRFTRDFNPGGDPPPDGFLQASHRNLQNIPTATQFSRRNPQAFCPRKGWQLIRRRLLPDRAAHPHPPPAKRCCWEAYANGDDVHALTARLLLDKTEVTARSAAWAKTINIGRDLNAWAPSASAREQA